ncbi:MAG TPA: hypothetical protein VHF88_01475 [Thermoleophilaceae bacterium]|nr:hypothetical protein [Thermoleophilaceae bacterium]
MASPQVNLRLSESDIQRLDQLAGGLGLSRTETVRFALYELQRSDPVRRRNRFAEMLREQFGHDALLRVELDRGFDVLGTVDGEHQPDLYLPTFPTRFGDDDFVQVWIGDPATDDVRILLGLIPMRTGVHLDVPLAELNAAMAPKAVAWFT